MKTPILALFPTPCCGLYLAVDFIFLQYRVCSRPCHCPDLFGGGMAVEYNVMYVIFISAIHK
jgi:hypothetical protein